MAEEKFYSPLRIGLLIVALAYFLFALHDTFTLSWIGEWNRIYPGHFVYAVYVEDIVAFVGTIFRFAAGIVSFAAIVYYFAKKSISRKMVLSALMAIAILEGLYWVFSFLPTGYFETQTLIFSNHTLIYKLNSFALGDLPVLVESIVLPIFLFILAYKLQPNRLLKVGIRWSLIYGAIYVFFLWLMNTTIWVGVYQEKGKGWAFLSASPQYLLSFVFTAAGLLILAIYTVVFVVKSRNADLSELSLDRVGAIMLALGLYFLWNYLTWIYFGGWNDWYAWFLGHNEDLWILSLPMLGIPLLFSRRPQENRNLA